MGRCEDDFGLFVFLGYSMLGLLAKTVQHSPPPDIIYLAFIHPLPLPNSAIAFCSRILHLQFILPLFGPNEAFSIWTDAQAVGLFERLRIFANFLANFFQYAIQ